MLLLGATRPIIDVYEWRNLTRSYNSLSQPVKVVIFVLKDSALKPYCEPLEGAEYWYHEFDPAKIGNFLTATICARPTAAHAAKREDLQKF